MKAVAWRFISSTTKHGRTTDSGVWSSGAPGSGGGAFGKRRRETTRDGSRWAKRLGSWAGKGKIPEKRFRTVETVWGELTMGGGKTFSNFWIKVLNLKSMVLNIFKLNLNWNQTRKNWNKLFEYFSNMELLEIDLNIQI
jgi:hypothetical protein